MPIRFRCPTCTRQLSTARRKAGTQVVCPRCENQITVPDTDLNAIGTADEPRQTELVTAGITKPERIHGISPSPRITGDGTRRDDRPLFEREDFESLLEPVARKVSEEAKPKPEPLPPQTSESDDSILIGRGALAALVVLMVVLLAMAFVTGYLVGSL